MITMTDEQLKEYCHLMDDMFGDGGKGRFDTYDDYVDHCESLFGDYAPVVDRDLFNKLLVIDIDINYFAEYQYVSVPEDMMFEMGFALVKLTTLAIAKGQVMYCKNDSYKGYSLAIGYMPSQLSIIPTPSKVKSSN